MRGRWEVEKRGVKRTDREHKDILYEVSATGEVGYWVQIPADVPIYSPVVLQMENGKREVYHTREIERIK